MLEQVLAHGELRPDLPALGRAGKRPITYGELGSRVRSVAGNLASSGMQPGDRVLFSVRPSLESVVLILAVARLGGVVVAADPTMGDEVFSARVALAGPRWVMAESWLLALGRRRGARTLLARRGLPLVDLTSVEGCRFVRVGAWWPGGPRSLSYSALHRANVGVAGATPMEDPAAPLFVVFTSGTTGLPKAVLHTRGSAASCMDLLAGLLRFEVGDVLYSSHLHLTVPALMAGALTVIPARLRFSAAQMLDEVTACTATHLFAIPAELKALAELCAARGAKLPPSLRVIMVGSAPIAASVLAQLSQVLEPGTAVWCAYAMSEALPVCVVDMAEKLAFREGGDLVGGPLEGVSLRVESDGEVLLRGSNLFWGYLGGPPVDELATGDLGYLDDRGRLILLGRKKDMIIRGHHNIYPSLVEASICCVQGVGRCALIGLTDHGTADEVVVLAVEPAPGVRGDVVVERLRRELREGLYRIDAAAQPDHIVATSLPTVRGSGEVDRKALREELKDLVGC
jgi:acyl-CoA synthetase (AMP-forming)/AMP-acid ligase II